jgi:hypothetical protein
MHLAMFMTFKISFIVSIGYSKFAVKFGTKDIRKNKFQMQIYLETVLDS